MSGGSVLLQGIPTVSSVSYLGINATTSWSYQMPPVARPADGYYTVIMTGSRQAYNSE